MIDTTYKTSFDFCLTLEWLGANANFTDRLCISNALPDAKTLPEDLVSWCRNAKAGDCVQARIRSAQLIPGYDPDLHRTYDHDSPDADELTQEFDMFTIS